MDEGRHVNRGRRTFGLTPYPRPAHKMEGPINYTFGESVVAVLMADFAAVFAAILGFAGSIYLCSALLSGEMSQ